MQSTHSAVAIFRLILGGLNPPILTIIVILFALEWLTHRKRNWSLLLGGWLINLLYLYTESFGESAGVFGLNIGQFAGTNLSLLTSTLFLAYFFVGADPNARSRGLAQAFSFAFAALFLSLASALVLTGSILSPFRFAEMSPRLTAIIYSPLIIFSCFSTLCSAYRLEKTLRGVRALPGALICKPWAVYGVLQIFYYTKFLPNKWPITMIFGLAFIAKTCIAAGLVLLYVDEAKAYQAQRIRMQYESRQQMAFSWFAHELKNPVLAIRLAADSIVGELKQNEISKAAKAARKLLDVAGTLVTVIESVKLAAEPFDVNKLRFLPINDAIEEAVAQVRILKPISAAAVRADYSARLVVCAVKENLIQVFSNMIRNGLEAIEEWNTGGLSGLPTPLIAIETRKAMDSGRLCARVRIVDFGPGVTQEIVNEIFQPYFSTKNGVNRGLGLWVVRNFLEAFGGRVRLESPLRAMDHGAMFEVYLPLVDRADIESLTPEDYWRRSISAMSTEEVVSQ